MDNIAAIYKEQYYNLKDISLMLMCADNPVMSFNIDSGDYRIENPNLMPYQLVGKIKEQPSEPNYKSKEDVQKYIAKTLQVSGHNKDAVTSYFASRVLPITRANAKKIYGLFGFEQAQDDYSKARIAIICRSVSLLDNYWIRRSSDEKEWKDIDIRQNHLSEIVAQVSLHGSSLTLQGEPCTPELNGHGAYAKAWIREPDGLYLHKLGSNGGELESKIEVAVSNILDKTNVDHVRYFADENGGKYTCKCKCMTTETKSILSGMDFISYCNVNNLNPDIEMKKLDADSLYKMWIVDYLISNRDRHGMNWGFFYDANTMQIEGCHPLFDHNNSFDEELMKNKEAPYLFDNRMTMREAAQYAAKRTNIVIKEPIKKEDFLTKDQYDSFVERAEEIGLSLERAHLTRAGDDLAYIGQQITDTDAIPKLQKQTPFSERSPIVQREIEKEKKNREAQEKERSKKPQLPHI